MIEFLLWFILSALGVMGICVRDIIPGEDNTGIRLCAAAVLVITQISATASIVDHTHEKAFCQWQGGIYRAKNICIVGEVYKEPLYTFTKED